MRKKVLWVGLVVLVGGTATYFVWRQGAANQDERDFQEQLKLARAEGLPTNGAEFAAYVPKSKPSENAAPYYRRLRPMPRLKRDPIQVANDLTFEGASTQEIQELLETYSSQFRLIDQAAALPHCWFDRDWSKGAAVLYTELPDMKLAAKLLMARGSLAAKQGRVRDAIGDVHRTFRIAVHAGEEPTVIPRLVRETIFKIALKTMASWSFAYRNEKTYAEELTNSVSLLPKPNLKDEYRDELTALLSLIDLTLSKKGRQELGLRDEEQSPVEAIFPVLLSRPKARVSIVKAERAFWKALDLPAAEMGPAIGEARHRLNMALLAYPTAALVYEKLSMGGDEIRIVTTRIPNFESGVLQFRALARALINPSIPKRIPVDDLLSPFDGKPVRYQFDGKQIVISVPGYGYEDKPTLLKLPPDSPEKERVRTAK